MQITLDGCHDDDAGLCDIPFFEQRLEDLHSLVHGLCGHQDFRDEHLSFLKLLTDSIHALQHAVVQNIFRCHTGIQRFLHVICDLVHFAFYNVIRNEF